MNIKQSVATLPGIALGALLLAAAPAGADYNDRNRGAVYAYAKVINVEPVVRYVTVRTPVRECWEEEREYRVNNRHRSGVAGGTLFGAILGGVIGHQFGSGSGNDAATAAGALIGAAVGSDSARRRDDGYDSESYTRPVQRCRTNYTSREEQRVDGYRVTYRYNGQKYATRMPYDPGERLRIRVDVRPAE